MLRFATSRHAGGALSAGRGAPRFATSTLAAALRATPRQRRYATWQRVAARRQRFERRSGRATLRDAQTRCTASRRLAAVRYGSRRSATRRSIPGVLCDRIWAPFGRPGERFRECLWLRTVVRRWALAVDWGAFSDALASASGSVFGSGGVVPRRRFWVAFWATFCDAWRGPRRSCNAQSSVGGAPRVVDF